DRLELTAQLHEFTKVVLSRMLLKTVNVIISVHLHCLDSTIKIAYNMAQNGFRVPPRIKFAKTKEEELYNSLMEMATKKQDELKKMICGMIDRKKEELIQKAATCEIVGIELSEDGLVGSSKDLKFCSEQIEDFVLLNLNGMIAGELVNSVDVLRESYIGILSRCLKSLEQLDVETGLESSRTSRALKDILSTAYQVNITLQTNDSFVRAFIERMKHVLHSIWSRPSMKIDADWKKKVASEMLSSLNESRCQKSICNQIKERLKKSHQTFEQCLKQLEVKHSGQLERTEVQRLTIRKEYAPRVAKLSLESRSLRDLLLHGKPKLGAMIGNGQYGVVFMCDSWAGFKPCAVKTMVPPDEKHWNDLAMEFYYTMNIPEHDRIAVLRGSVIDYTYSSNGLAVMLIMDKLDMDLHTAIEKKLSWIERLQISIDVVEGIRYLHSQGLVHRDIKLKNVLIDGNKRAKLTDLGFCKPETLMTGSIVGTPIHMAPELVSGKYDHSVDIYAFGVLFWYLCSGCVQLPLRFEKCPSKEVLWNCVKKGCRLRPEKPKDVDPECWDLMLACWHSNPDVRPLLGEIELTLRSIFDRVVKEAATTAGKAATIAGNTAATAVNAATTAANATTKGGKRDNDAKGRADDFLKCEGVQGFGADNDASCCYHGDGDDDCSDDSFDDCDDDDDDDDEEEKEEEEEWKKDDGDDDVRRFRRVNDDNNNDNDTLR
ncbi:hypothetical protein HELRODRAFT_72374, partial [Helobdella robusta]|uniref:Dual serine/threonine and tyrosine protein kinase n=1 Tax=Helobdella robusta TaxID=6412 RepID=T1G0Z0_HELRO